MSFDIPDVSEMSCDLQMKLFSDDESLPPINRVMSPVPQHRRRRRKLASKITAAALKNEKKRSCELLEKILLAKQQALNDQQCKLNFLQSQMHTLKEDNRLLKAQGHAQAAIIERLDGKNAKLPMLMNSQMEEIRVYRERLKRLKDIFMRTTKAMQESENARYRAEDELQHLRALAFERNLPEREELVTALQQLRFDFESMERDKKALEKYVLNLEKNTQCERRSLLKRQRELQAHCAALAATVRGLQSDLQEKQRMLQGAAAGQRSAVRSAVCEEATPKSATSTKTGAKMKTLIKEAHRARVSVTSTKVPRKNKMSSSPRRRPSTTVLKVKHLKIDDILGRPQTVGLAGNMPASTSEKNSDVTLKALKTNETLARIAAESKIKELEQKAKTPPIKEADVAMVHKAAFVDAQTLDEWPEFEMVEPLNMKPLPRPVKVQSDIREMGKSGVVAAKGDSEEVSEILQKLPSDFVRDCSTTVISGLVREVLAAKQDMTSSQLEVNRLDDCDDNCYISPREPPAPTPCSVQSQSETSIGEKDLNNEKAITNSCSTRLAFKLYESHPKTPQERTSSCSRRLKTKTPSSSKESK